MLEENFQTPILFLIFNRPDTTRRVFAAIKKIRPKKLYIAADGPRKGKVGEKELCEETRNIVKNIDWDCKVKTLFRQKNLGLKKAVSSAITWFFENEKAGIILEDDCLPHPSFFNYVEELLAKYRNSNRIKMISGDNFQNGWSNTTDSYYFSRYCNIWGWATWRRAWTEYQLSMKSYPKFLKNRKMNQIFQDSQVRRYWKDIFDRVYSGEINTWDYQWVYSVWANDGLAIIPNVNLVSNLGCQSGTNTAGKNSKDSEIKSSAIKFPLKHPEKIEQNFAADDRFSNKFFKLKLSGLMISKVKRLISKLIKKK